MSDIELTPENTPTKLAFYRNHNGYVATVNWFRLGEHGYNFISLAELYLHIDNIIKSFPVGEIPDLNRVGIAIFNGDSGKEENFDEYGLWNRMVTPKPEYGDNSTDG